MKLTHLLLKQIHILHQVGLSDIYVSIKERIPASTINQIPDFTLQLPQTF